MQDDCRFDESILLDYLRGAAPPEVQVQIERTAACQTAVQQLAAQLAALYRIECPDAPMLVAYQEQQIAESTLQLMLRQHIATCTHCTEELALLTAIDTVALVPRQAPLRRLVMAVFQSPLGRAQPIRGDVLQYQVEHMSVHLRVRPQIERRAVWTVRGQLRAADGHLAGHLVQGVRARPRADADQPIFGQVDAHGAFRFDELYAGVYALEIDTPDCTIVIDQLSIGNP